MNYTLAHLRRFRVAMHSFNTAVARRDYKIALAQIDTAIENRPCDELLSVLTHLRDEAEIRSRSNVFARVFGLVRAR